MQKEMLSRLRRNNNTVILNLFQDLNHFIRRNKVEMLKQVQHDNMGVCGFTLIELLVVVLIIGILVAVAVPQYQKAVWKSRALEKRTYAQKLMEVFDLYDLAGGVYPNNGQVYNTQNKDLFEKLDIDFPERAYEQMNTYFAGGRPVYGQWYVKYPDFSVCIGLLPGSVTSRRIICGASTSLGEQICQSICGTSTEVSLACGSSPKGCYM